MRTVVITCTVLCTLSLLSRHNTLPSECLDHQVWRCDNTTTELGNLTEVTRRTHELLEKNHLAHILCYGALFCTLRQSAILAGDVDFCITTDEQEYIEQSDFQRQLNSSGISLLYDPHEGVYHVTYGQAQCKLVVFEYSKDYH